MARIDERTEQFLQQFTQQMVDLLGEELRSVILYGSAAGPHFLPGISDVNVLIVLREIMPDRLPQAADRLKRFRKERLEPLFVDHLHIALLAESYPIELLEMKEQHRVLHGEDVLQGVNVLRERLPLQLMSELLGKSLRLRALYVDTGRDARRMEDVLSRATNSFRVLMRTLLRLSEQSLIPPTEYLEIVTQVEERLGLSLPGLRDIYQVKLGTRRLLREELNHLFEQILREADILTRCASELPPQAS